MHQAEVGRQDRLSGWTRLVEWLVQRTGRRVFPTLVGRVRAPMQALRLGEVLSTIASTEAAIPFTVSLAQAMRAIKAVSSHWLRETCESCREFAWQEGYGAFSVGIAQIERTMDYIQRQEEHHQVQRYEDVFLGFLKRHEIEYDDRYVWG